MVQLARQKWFNPIKDSLVTTLKHVLDAVPADDGPI
jgi:hypothetical protein